MFLPWGVSHAFQRRIDDVCVMIMYTSVDYTVMIELCRL